MAIEPQNLIQVQSSLQDPFTVKNEDLIKYANGSNPEVPAFLALIEMNRRKQIEEGSAALDTTKGTIKDQVAGSLTAPPSGVNPTANPYTVNPAAAPNMANPTANPFELGITQLPQGVNPTQAPPVQQPSPARPVMAAGGGLMSLPVNHFNEQSYAGGGIVAFGNPDLNPDEQQLVSFPQERPNKRVLTDAQIAAELAKSQVAPVAPTPAPKAGSYEAILASLPKAPEITSTAPESINRAQAFEGIKESQRLAGVAEDPYADTKKRQTAKEKREQEKALREIERAAAEEARKSEQFAKAQDREAKISLSEAEKLERQAGRLEKVPAADVRVRGDQGSLSTTRIDWDGYMVDRENIDLEALRHHLREDDINHAIKQFVKAGGRSLRGASIFEETKLNVR